MSKESLLKILEILEREEEEVAFTRQVATIVGEDLCHRK